jgi:hypothetical protein
LKGERGSVPIWFLGLAFCLLMLGAVSAELWRIIGDRQELVALADGAAVAAASAIDLEHYRDTGEALLDVESATALAVAVLARTSGEIDLSEPPSVTFADDRSSVRVELHREVPFGLIGFLPIDDRSFDVSGVSVAYPFSP